MGKVASFAVGVIAVLFAYFLHDLSVRAGGVQSIPWEDLLRGRPRLRAVDVIDERNLTLEAFINDYVDAQKPVAIKLQEDAVLDIKAHMLSRCGDMNVPLVSPATASVVESLPQVVRTAFSILLRICGVSVNMDEEIQARKDVRLGDYLSTLQNETKPAARPLLLSFLPPIVGLAFDIFSRPRYLHDLSMHHVCPSLLKQWPIPRYGAANWGALHSHCKDQFDLNPYLFAGGQSSMAYPMHQNMFRADVMLHQVQGTKRGVFFEATANAQLLGRWKQGGADMYSASGFASSRISAPLSGLARGWQHTLCAGELLYMPGRFIHQFENENAAGNASIALKYWFGGRSFLCDTDDHACQVELDSQIRARNFEHHFNSTLSTTPVSFSDYKRFHELRFLPKRPSSAFRDLFT